jgi:hypothetical protein
MTPTRILSFADRMMEDNFTSLLSFQGCEHFEGSVHEPLIRNNHRLHFLRYPHEYPDRNKAVNNTEWYGDPNRSVKSTF